MVRTISQLSRSNSRDARGTLGFFVLVSMGLHAVSTLGILLLFGAFIGLSQKAPPSLVQLEGGKAIITEAIDSRERTPAVIQKFTQDSLTLLMSASGKLPSPDGKSQPVDSGVEVNNSKGGTKKISSVARLAGFSLSEDFRSTFLQQLSEITPQGIFNDNTAQTVLVVQDVSTPHKVAEGQWKVTVIANLLSFSSADQVGSAIAFNKEVFVRSVTPPVVTKASSELEQQIAQVRSSGLEIYAMRDFVQPDLH
jgi:hypothetical protein